VLVVQQEKTGMTRLPLY